MTKWCVERFSKSDGWIPLEEIQTDDPDSEGKIELRTVRCRDLSREEADRIHAYLQQHVVEPDNIETHTKVNVEFGSGCWDYKGAGSAPPRAMISHSCVISLDDFVDVERKYKSYGMTLAGSPHIYRGGMGGDQVSVIIDRDTGDEDQMDPYYPNKRWRRIP